MAQIYGGAGRASSVNDAPLGAGWAVKNGIIGGLLAALVFAALEMLGSWIMQGSLDAPLRMIAGVPLQQPPDQIDGNTALIVGLISHMAYAMVVGVIIAFIVAGVPALRRSASATILFSAVVNLITFPLNFYVIAPLLNAPWFAQTTDPMMIMLQALYHLVFGAVIGWYLANRLPVTVSGPTGSTA